MTNTQTIAPNATKLLPIGRMWVNERDNGKGTSPAMNISIDNNLGLNITLNPGSKLVIFKNEKRPGRKDPDFRVAVSVPVDVAVAEIARQKATKGQQGVSVAVA